MSALPSDALGNITCARPTNKPLPPPSPLLIRAPRIQGAADSSWEASMASNFGGVGRPTAVEITRQREDFRALVAAGVPLVDAARRAGCKPERALAEVEVIVRSILERAA